MGLDHSPIIVTDGLSVYLDAGNTRSYSGSGNTWYNLITGAIGGTMVGVGYSTLNGGYFNFTGSQYMTFANTPPIGQSNLSSTVEIISYRNTYDFGVMLGGGPYGTNQGYWFGHRNATDNFMMAYFANDSDTITSTTNLIWNQYVAVYDNSIGRRATYYNSNLLKNEASGVSNTSNSSYFIGAYREDAGTPAYQYNGRIASVKIYNRALTATEILQNYNAAKKRYGK
jgi:hypothetical protein